MANCFLMLQSNPSRDSTESVANKALAEQAVPQGKNFVMSSLSYKAILSVVALGSTGKTQQQLLSFMGLNHPVHLSSLCKQIMSITASTPVLRTAFVFPPQAEALEISFANTVWLHEDFSFKPTFEAIVKDLFNAESQVIDHGEPICGITDRINSWAASVTKGQVNQILPRDFLNGKARLVLANAIYFKGKWVHKFDRLTSQYRNFHLINGQCVRASFMTSTKKSRPYGYFNNFKILALPYQSGQDQRRFQMYIFLPDKINGLQNLIRMMNCYPGFLNRNFNLEEVELGELWIPKFKFSYEFEGSKILQDLGLTLPFKEDNKDFTGIAVSHKGETMYVSKVFHKAYIEVDEEGTEASAVTVCHFSGFGSAAIRSGASFVADHPFFFSIREEASNTVFFNGAVLNPLVDS